MNCCQNTNASSVLFCSGVDDALNGDFQSNRNILFTCTLVSSKKSQAFYLGNNFFKIIKPKNVHIQ